MGLALHDQGVESPRRTNQLSAACPYYEGEGRCCSGCAWAVLWIDLASGCRNGQVHTPDYFLSPSMPGLAASW
jgi:hypothetical protein